MAQLTRTDETEDEDGLRAFYSIDPEDAVENRIATHDGAWVREGERWRWWSAVED
jgi:hypothetical protein